MTGFAVSIVRPSSCWSESRDLSNRSRVAPAISTTIDLFLPSTAVASASSPRHAHSVYFHPKQLLIFGGWSAVAFDTRHLTVSPTAAWWVVSSSGARAYTCPQSTTCDGCGVDVAAARHGGKVELRTIPSKRARNGTTRRWSPHCDRVRRDELITDSSLRGYTGRNENAIRNGRFDSVYLSVFVLIKKTFSRSLLTTDFEKFFVYK